MELGALIGARIRETRKTRGLTQEELAERIDKAASTISEFERGNIMPHLSTLYAMAAALNVEPGDLLPALTDDDPERAKAIASALAILRNLEGRSFDQAISVLKVL
ncbi:helix-turn-helix transcriptional regulator [Limibacillus sp. MBR-115]|uniref:helix-turn-helix domain-containing protein n=1 Tax=Limibacillus sp. MBR-115 TaxID=3156465 RepID=UPI00339A1D70